MRIVKRHNFFKKFEREIYWFLKEKLNTKDFLIYDVKILKENEELIKDFLEKRERGYPFQYIVGNVEFFGEKILVEEGVFIPRPETEILVEEAINLLKDKKELIGLDLCCGSLNIGIVLCKYLDIKRLYAVDISEKAIKISKKNLHIHNLKEKICLIRADLLEAFTKKEIFDFICANPPYVATSELGSLQKEITYEPIKAFIGGKDGLDVIKKIIFQSYDLLKKEGYLICEIGHKHSSELSKILKKLSYSKFWFKKDFQDIDRILILQK